MSRWVKSVFTVRKLCFSIVEERCPEMVAPENGSLSTYLVDVGVVVIVTCEEGYAFELGAKEIIIECLSNSTGIKL